MSFAESLSLAVEAALYPQLSNLSRQLWQAWASGALSDDDAQRLAAVLHARRSGGLPQYIGPLKNASGGFLLARARAPERHFDRRRSIERRRRLAYSGPLPPALAAGFSVAELAALRI